MPIVVRSGAYEVVSIACHPGQSGHGRSTTRKTARAATIHVLTARAPCIISFRQLKQKSMKVLGVKQFHQKTFKLLDLKKSKFKPILGDVPTAFVLVVIGYSGNGKTEFCMQLAKELCQHGTVAWLSYEQRHGYDLQKATIRNDMEAESGKFYPVDPIAGIKDNVSLMEDLDGYLKKRNSPDFIFIDSVDYTGFKFSDYVHLRNRYGAKKSFIFIGHSSKNGKCRKAVTEDIMFDGGMGILVRDFIATPVKNRFGGFEEMVVFEEMARKRNPAFFAKQVKEDSPKKQKQ